MEHNCSIVINFITFPKGKFRHICNTSGLLITKSIILKQRLLLPINLDYSLRWFRRLW